MPVSSVHKKGVSVSPVETVLDDFVMIYREGEAVSRNSTSRLRLAVIGVIAMVIDLAGG